MLKKSSMFVYLFLILSILIISGCGNRDSNVKEGELAKGNDGIVMNFLADNPQDKYIVSDSEEPISIILELRNKGSYPRPGDSSLVGRGN